MKKSQSPAIELRGVTKAYRGLKALDDVDLVLEGNRIYGLLGRNGAGKTTLMGILAGQGYASSGKVRVNGADPFENDGVLSRICFIRESQKYPDDFNAGQAFRAAALFFTHWDTELAARLAKDFALPLKRRIKKLSRGQLSAVGVIIGLASRAEITFFDEPYLGLDAVARQLFYDHLVADFALHPRTIVLSSHLIDEVANLLEHIILIDKGRIVLDAEADEIRGSAVTVTGAGAKVDPFIAGRRVLHRDALGSLASATIEARLDAAERARAAVLGLEISPVSLQQLVVRTALAAGNRTESDPEMEMLK
ncbi:ABC transporter ATP-binding protein [Paeniglutamicibacter cryotolerans]|uniref:ABC-2 type transport system ATP-binding protein n=1 Tax=Paeniglutamicibacter cryotolerans TaxID=670079 RepID=A0A839QQZ8_9MICC|nr:ABC transporter ATP-binding protein [Paeniglutamicibacter cryotolerans]MBB2996416.1 ABC-2 type transport system ATP-binding protein [Paeniglutamicibacter cryotolerans]